MTVRMYRSADRGAMVLTGQNGKLIDLLKQCLVVGYPTQTPTSITRSGAVATVSKTAHGFTTGQVVTVNGAAEVEYNGNFVVTVTTADAFTYAVTGTPATPATGTITIAGEVKVGTVTLARSGSTVTASLTAHGFSVGQRARIDGAVQADYNDIWTVATVPDANSFTFTLPAGLTPTTPATGTISVYYGQAGAGWTQPYTGSNLAAFRNSSTGGTGSYLKVQDDHASTNARAANLVGYVTMSAISTGTDQFPEVVTYMGVWKSLTADATARPWVVLADEYRFVLLIQNGENSTDWIPIFFGDIYSYVPSDAYRALLMAAYSTSGVAGQSYTLNLFAISDVISTTRTAKKMPRTYTGAGSQINVGTHSDNMKISATPSTAVYVGSAGMTYPLPHNGGLIMAPIWVHEASLVRGYLPGVWAPMHNRPLANNDVFSGAGTMAGKRFEAFNVYSGGQLLIETSDTWS